MKQTSFSQQTLEALAEYDEMKAYPEKYKRYSAFQEALDELLTEDE